MYSPVASAANYSIENGERDSNRRSANYHPTIWGDHFLSYAAHSSVVKPDPEAEKRIETLKAEVRKFISQTNDEIVTLVDELQRLGVSYHFEYEIMEALRSIYNRYVNHINNIAKQDDNQDLYTVSLCFRLLRQQGYKLSADIFNKFKDENDEFKAMLTNDVRALLCLFEASHLRIQGEYILKEASKFSRKHLKSLLPYLSSSLAKQVKHSLEIPLHKGMQRLETRHYISVYEANEAARNDLLLELAKVDFNLLQAFHRRELSDISR